jgi:hypothetical protein
MPVASVDVRFRGQSGHGLRDGMLLLVQSGHCAAGEMRGTDGTYLPMLLRLGAGELHDLGPRLGVGRDRSAVVLRRAGQRDAAKA